MPLRTQRNTILLKGDLDDRYDEAVVAVTYLPGMLLEMTSINAVRPCTLVDQVAIEFIVGIEDALVGKTVDDAYPVGEVGRFMFIDKGNEFQGLLKFGSPAVVPGDFVQSNGDGCFKKLVTGKPLARVLEAKDLSLAITSDFVILRATD